jgi:NAD(P)-dependent dehydrogenase (short-subunit alcohol dehydrogenase family)
VKPEEIAKAILFLLSGEATAVTGAELLISGRT